ncbi:hypothetical protein ATCV1_z361L [Acanthocystis turfacea chlorella virus 1]|uniref:Uncharacterized protein z361L n=1 Tax=Chlorovirus heliozoae TaxID=322019 RepID=A7K8X1_9PHYC|nr:hypothetical protein ATCV1_z361L [Acanthocystis turfacea chlorella virus 1]ABT16495.1 hypothetical protein ATCV1_z361L [Acanthocystis turfacea chlorella virus 1]
MSFLHVRLGTPSTLPLKYHFIRSSTSLVMSRNPVATSSTFTNPSTGGSEFWTLRLKSMPIWRMSSGEPAVSFSLTRPQLMLFLAYTALLMCLLKRSRRSTLSGLNPMSLSMKRK